jgi:pimeloyl-ACP methyl ester carboxylesterase
MDQVFKLPDSRLLVYHLYGPENGRPVLYFHGTPSSRLEPQLLPAFGIDLQGLLKKAGMQLIAVDRPGMGWSTHHTKGNRFLSFANDIRLLMEQLGVGKCPVLCWSGGGPYALAVASRYPQLISGVYILCGFTRHFDAEIMHAMGFNKWYFRSARFTPLILQAAMQVISKKEVKRFVPQHLTGLAYVDYALLSHPPHLKAVTRYTLKEACRQGAAGPVYEARQYYHDFGFPLSSITQPVHYWWGTMDGAIVRMHPEALEKHVPSAVLYYREGEGHLSMYLKGFVEAMERMSEE